jgi:Fur family ferric uptake transcriptional regulator
MAFRMKTTPSAPKPPLAAAAFDSEALLRESGLRVTRAAQTVLELLNTPPSP